MEEKIFTRMLRSNDFFILLKKEIVNLTKSFILIKHKFQRIILFKRAKFNNASTIKFPFLRLC